VHACGFQFEEVADVAQQSLATHSSKPQQFDEFADVWAESEAALSGSGSAPTRKVLKASNAQKKVEKPDSKELARLALDAQLKAAEERAEQDRLEKERLAAEGLQNPLLAKLGIAPTNILAQYDSDKLQPAEASKTKAAPKKKREQDMLESNDAVLAASGSSVVAASSPAATSSSSAAAPTANVVEALVSAHTSSSGDLSQAQVEQLDQWGAVNSLREKQEASAREEAARSAKEGKTLGVKHVQITRDTPIHYDAALRSLTVAPSCPSSAAPAADGSSSAPPPSTAVQIQLLKQRIQSTDFRDVGFGRKMRYTLFPPKLKSARLEEERDLVFCMALMKIDYEHCVDHERILCSLYRGLTNDPLAPPTFGNHWQVIGFQDKDPATDLRGAGLFSLIQLLWGMKHHKELMLKIYALSLDDRQNFPFCTLSTNLTGMVLQALRECVLYGECRRQNSVYTVVHTLYVAAFYEMYLKWKNENCTIVHWNDVKQSVAAQSMRLSSCSRLSSFTVLIRFLRSFTVLSFFSRHVENLVLHSPKPLMAKFKANQYSAADAAQQAGALEFTEIP
jgi:hypothetical protein